MQTWIAKRPAVSFYVLTVTLSWGYWLTLLAQVYLATGHSILCAALWHTGYNMMVATELGTEWPAAIVGIAVMAWGVGVAVRWWRKPPDPRTVDRLLDPGVPAFDTERP